ncbi:hypothetical protein [Porphyromonas levii]|uniref:FeoB-associated Cys-rich membrane protein n=1 Tax=Porphyromonas levii TaxID=28114 RepID=A0A4Y8WM26_9PORP|nr:hypothetical protein [Porphyromonas levii]MBR8712430.1 hypothetical protein [Porphyromonas levii]MBR8714398.1 hypothetical protein [Porphyromonas levii]MBR8726939.1 hypothetical protein [Porphyromonas levii]MBR8728898.1 hypothetical protein [Porphyromonas levii]MBR8735269.1 hypothetical protein [Porphyromonas levii]
MIQTIITYAILVLVFVLAVRFLWKSLNPPKDVPPACSGCALRDACSAKAKKQGEQMKCK